MKTHSIVCGDGTGKEVTFIATGAEMIKAAKQIERAADPEDGIIQADSLLGLFLGRPELHATMHMSRALKAIGCDREVRA